jgi:hypothetical protein
MGRIRGWVMRLEHAAREDLASCELLDGSCYYFDPASAELFLHWYECLGAGSAHHWPEPPEVMRRVCAAKDPHSALEQVMESAAFSSLVYDPEVIITERRLEVRGLVSRYDPVLGEHVVGDPYDEEPEDLSEP